MCGEIDRALTDCRAIKLRELGAGQVRRSSTSVGRDRQGGNTADSSMPRAKSLLKAFLLSSRLDTVPKGCLSLATSVGLSYQDAKHKGVRSFWVAADISSGQAAHRSTWLLAVALGAEAASRRRRCAVRLLSWQFDKRAV